MSTLCVASCRVLIKPVLGGTSLTSSWCSGGALDPTRLPVCPQLHSVNGVGVCCSAHQVLHHASQPLKAMQVALQLLPQPLHLLQLLLKGSRHAAQARRVDAATAQVKLCWQDAGKPDAAALSVLCTLHGTHRGHVCTTQCCNTPS